jgi:hypothetical protein
MGRPYFLILCAAACIACDTSTTSISPGGQGGGVDSGTESDSSSADSTSAPAMDSSVIDTGTAIESGSVEDATGEAGEGEGSDAGGAPEGGTVAEGGAACAGLLCEDFEEGQLDTTKWDLEMGGGGNAMVQTQIVAHGKYAWHVNGTGAGGGFASILTKNAPAALKGAGPVYGRLYLYATANYGAHIQLGFAGTTRDPTVAAAIKTNGLNINYMEYAEFSNSWQLGFDLFTPAPNVAPGFVEECAYPPAHDMYPVMTWNCVEWEFDDNPDQMFLWFDGKQIDQFDAQHIDYTSTTKTAGSVLNGLSSGIIGGFDVFGFGFHSWGSSAVVDRYYDDIVLDTKRVGCLP